MSPHRLRKPPAAPFDTRRRLLLALAGSLLPASPLMARVLAPTPRQTAGPFYPEQLPLDDDNDLTRVQGSDARAEGVLVDLEGRLLDVDGTALVSQRVEIWQCDARGRYHHPRDPGHGAPDANFQGHGHTLTDGEGRYRFRTIRPVPYPGRTPHIHLAVFARQAEPFTTQIYVAGEPRNNDDWIYQRIPAELRPRVTAEFRAQADGTMRAAFDVVLGALPAA